MNRMLEQCRTVFKKNGIVDVSDFFDINIRARLLHEAKMIFASQKQRRDFVSTVTKTPRNLFVVSEKVIQEEGKYIPAFYHSDLTRQCLSAIAGESVVNLSWQGERYVINGLLRSGDNHGWHWDDYAFALVFIVKAPRRAGGGLLEAIPNIDSQPTLLNIPKVVNNHTVLTHYYPSGSFYFMRSDTTLHRVSPINAGNQRIALAMTWASQQDQHKQIDHQTVYELYGR